MASKTTTAAAALDVVFPPARNPKHVKLVIRNTSTRTLLAKLKTIGSIPSDNVNDFNSAVIPPKRCLPITLVLLPSGFVGKYVPEKPSTYVVLRDKDEMEVYCRLFSLDASTDGIKTEQIKFAHPGHPHEICEMKTKRTLYKNELAEMTKEEQNTWWEQHLSNYASTHNERMTELFQWAHVDVCEPERLAYKLRAIRDGNRFAASTVIVEIPGNASLIESVPYPMLMADDPDCRTAMDITFDMSTARPLKNHKLLKLAPSDSECKTVYSSYGGVMSCDWISRWLSWFIPITAA